MKEVDSPDEGWIQEQTTLFMERNLFFMCAKKCTFWGCPNVQQIIPILIQLGHKIKSEVIFFLVNLPIPRMHPKKYTFCDRGGKEMAAELYPHNEEETRRSYA